MKKYTPSYNNIPAWESYSANMKTEFRQCIEEGLDVKKYEGLFNAISELQPSEYRERLADVLFDMINDTPIIEDYPYNEPNDLVEIKALRDSFKLDSYDVNKDTLEDKIKGAWFGRVAGCLLGKPVEGMKYDKLTPLLKMTNNYPMHRYILNSDLTDDVCNAIGEWIKNGCYIDVLDGMPVDDDTNYVVMAQLLVDSYGRNFTPKNVSSMWIWLQSKNAYCTAERVAFRNFVMGYDPPDSASYKNPYREWIGAQIRGDYFGYINPGNPQEAADMAYRDASISHVKNGIYGEMFASAMIAAAAVCNDIKSVILAGLAQIPKTSRLYDSVNKIIEMHSNGANYDDCISYIHSIRNDKNEHDWCHTISNAMIVAAALLCGDGDFGKSVCMAVQAAFDTDCNGATVGSVIGMMNGFEAIDPVWTAPLKDTLHTSIFGVDTVSISECAHKTMNHIKE